MNVCVAYSRQEPKFYTNDQVYIRAGRQGPYKIAYVKDFKYTLCDGDGNSINGDTVYEEKDLELIDLFE